MIEGLSELQVNDILSSNKFINKYSSYEKEVDIDKLRNFFDDIETNKNYFRLNVKKSRKYINRNSDTITIKNINSNINKLFGKGSPGLRKGMRQADNTFKAYKNETND